ncbi:MAG TPA: response regulator transcription factor [Phototrophicaceae bacterium]|jgi:DNA-binding response OmpR family regulator|nr:response regulator transcription factor [Phototrophicaceae bacterium]
MYKILLVDNDAETLDMLDQLLKREGYAVSKAQSGYDALRLIEHFPPDMFVINMVMPGMDGLALCRKLRASPVSAKTPILFLNGADSAYGVADGLEVGGDDYLRKPFALRELTARIRAHLRRSARTPDDLPRLRIVPDGLAVYVNDRKVLLTQVEFDLLLFLCSTPNQLHSTQTLLSDVWQYPRGTGDTALVRNHVRNLRRKIEDDPERPAIIQSRHGRGYTVRAHVEVEREALSGQH